MSEKSIGPSDLPEVDGHIPVSHQAAVITVLMPPLAIALGVVANLTSRASIVAALAVSGISIVLLGFGFGCALLALSGIRAYGTNRLLSRGVAGLLLNGIFLLVIIVGMTRAVSGEAPA